MRKKEEKHTHAHETKKKSKNKKKQKEDKEINNKMAGEGRWKGEKKSAKRDKTPQRGNYE